MSSEHPELKAGHPPAVKAGGKRVVTKHKHEEPDTDAYDQKYVDSLPEQQQQIEKPQAISGVPVKGNQDFPVEVVQRYHEKQPIPKKEKAHSPTKQNMRISQPRKHN